MPRTGRASCGRQGPSFADERGHARALAKLIDGIRPQPRRQIARREQWHRGDRSGALRAGVFGVGDGLVSNTALVLGFAGSGSSRIVILLAGIAGPLAFGAFVVVLPYLVGGGTAALLSAIGLAVLASSAIDAGIGILNGRSALRSGLRRIIAGGLAAAITFGVGHLIGTAVS